VSPIGRIYRFQRLSFGLMTPPHSIDFHPATPIDPSIEISSKRSSNSSDTMEALEPVSSESRFLNDTELKAEIDTGNVSDQWFSFKKLWTYAGPGGIIFNVG
jgi:hypothetical protein